MDGAAGMRDVIGIIDWSLHVTCPRCRDVNNLSSPLHDGDNDIARIIFSGRWDTLGGLEIECEFCGYVFCMDCIEY